MSDLAAAVQAHAVANYSVGGWDIVVESYDRSAISDIIHKANATTPDAAIAAVGAIVGMIDEVRTDIQGA